MMTKVRSAILFPAGACTGTGTSEDGIIYMYHIALALRGKYQAIASGHLFYAVTA
jgi:hypothetical protein